MEGNLDPSCLISSLLKAKDQSFIDLSLQVNWGWLCWCQKDWGLWCLGL